MFRVIYFVSDPERVASFYEKAFGAKRLSPPVAQNYPSTEWIQVQTDCAEIAFHKLTNERPELKKPDVAFKMVFKVDDIEKKRQELKDIGVEMTEIIQCDHTRICDGWDSEGYRFQLADR